MNQIESPTLTGHTVFIDIDDTITRSTGYSSGKTIMTTLVKVVASCNSIGPQSAKDKIFSIFNPETQSISPHYSSLGITEVALSDAIMEWLPQEVAPFPDAIECIKGLRAQNYRIYPATTNSRLICHLKLIIAGLATRDGSCYFDDIFGGEEVHPEGKSCAGFFSNLLSTTNSRPEDVIHIGDLPSIDLRFAKLAGIRQVILPRRDQTQDWVPEEDGGIYVRSLEWVPKNVERRHSLEATSVK